MQLFDLLRIICRQAHEHGQADKADDAVEPGERQEHGDEPEYQKEDQPGRQDRTQAGKVALGEPAVGRQHAEIQRGQREHGEQDLNVVSEKDRGKRDAVEHRVGEEQAAGRADAQLMQTGGKHHHHDDLGNGKREYRRHAHRQQVIQAAARRKRDSGTERDQQTQEHPAKGLGGIYVQRLGGETALHPLAAIFLEHRVKALLLIHGSIPHFCCVWVECAVLHMTKV